MHTVREALGTGGFLMLNNRLRFALGNDAAIVLAVLVSWHNTYRINLQLQPDGSFFFTGEKGMREANMGRRVWDKALKTLEAHSLISTVVKGVPAKKHFYIDYEVIAGFLDGIDGSVADELQAAKCSEPEQVNSSLNKTDKLDEVVQNDQASLYKTDKLTIYSNTKERYIESDNPPEKEGEGFNPLPLPPPPKRKPKGKEGVLFEEQFPTKEDFFAALRKLKDKWPRNIPKYTDFAAYYYALDNWSNKGNRKINWLRTLFVWVEKDMKKGELKVNEQLKQAMHEQELKQRIEFTEPEQPKEHEQREELKENNNSDEWEPFDDIESVF